MSERVSERVSERMPPSPLALDDERTYLEAGDIGRVFEERVDELALPVRPVERARRVRVRKVPAGGQLLRQPIVREHVQRLMHLTRAGGGGGATGRRGQPREKEKDKLIARYYKTTTCAQTLFYYYDYDYYCMVCMVK